jgi:hypothetical protein
VSLLVVHLLASPFNTLGFFASSSSSLVRASLSRTRRGKALNFPHAVVADRNHHVLQFPFPPYRDLLTWTSFLPYRLDLYLNNEPAIQESLLARSERGPFPAVAIWTGVIRHKVRFYAHIHECYSDSGFREFILANYPVIKQHNQDLPVMIREAEGTPARVFARFGELEWTKPLISLTSATCRTWR